MRHWLLTSTFYGNWLPGDPRGFVSSVRDLREGEAAYETRQEHDIPGTPYDEDLPGLYHAAQELLRGEPIRLSHPQAVALATQFHETAACRGWRLLAFAIMGNHIHIVVEVEGDPKPGKILGDFKAYGSRALSAKWGVPRGETWWTAQGSKRKLEGERAVRAAVRYVRDQECPLVIWLAPVWVAELAEFTQ